MNKKLTIAVALTALAASSFTFAATDQVTAVIKEIGEVSESGDGFTFKTTDGNEYYIYAAEDFVKGGEYLTESEKKGTPVCLKLNPEHGMGDIAAVSKGACSSGKSTGDWYMSTAEPALTVRDSAGVTGKKIGSVPVNGKVKVVEKTGVQDSISGKSGEWVKIEWDGSFGYAFDSFLVPVDGTKKDTQTESKSSNNGGVEEGLINALRLKSGGNERMADSGKAIQAYMKAGLLDKKPAGRSDYTDFYILKQPASFMGHKLVVIEEEYMSEYIGCCVSPGAGVIVEAAASVENLAAFASKNGCSVEEHVNLEQELSGLDVKLPTGDFTSLSCRERDISQ
ncbi:SH3 domain-containing protein (plasmid) [Thiothrix subterranea]|uniref:SH3 domain-containing protein n=1 Tax=Thiothrix subterranea TaxID=2735563 RepID=UPI00192A8575|nr:SH3 domain-containing protein [Thiothrix subterranea]QQZ31098.1 SH3 domain-containing protein [Thiothrix subterranea]